MNKEEKQKKLETALLKIKKDQGKEVVFNLDDDKAAMEFIPLSSLALRYVIHPQGFVRGRIYEFFGQESNGKSVLTSLIAKDVQANGGIVGLLDYEHSVDLDFNKKVIGMKTDSDNFILFTPESTEDGFKIIDDIADSGAVDLLIVDSTNAMPCKRELAGEHGDSLMGAGALALSSGLRRSIAKIAKSKMSVIFISQIRNKIVTFGDPNVVGIGNAMKFFASCRLQVQKQKNEDEKENEGIDQLVIKINNKKNKMYTPYRSSFLTLNLTKGLDLYGEVFDFAEQYKLLDKAGSWYTLAEEKKVQGRDKVIDYFKENQKFYDDLKSKIEKELYVKYDNNEIQTNEKETIDDKRND